MSSRSESTSTPRRKNVYSSLVRDTRWKEQANEFDRAYEELMSSGTDKPTGRKKSWSTSSLHEYRKLMLYPGTGTEEDKTEGEEQGKEFVGRGLSQEDTVRALATLSPETRMIDLSTNGLASVSCLPRNLCILSLSCNRLQTLEDLGDLVSLQQLDVSRNELSSLEGLYKSSQSLRTINASNNRIVSVTGLETMQRLVHLDIGYNRIGAVSHIRGLSCNVSLVELRLRGNPVANRPSIRQIVMDLVPSLLTLDSCKVSVSPHVVPGKKAWTYTSLFASQRAQRQQSAVEMEETLVDVEKAQRKQRTPKRLENHSYLSNQKNTPQQSESRYSAGPARSIALLETAEKARKRRSASFSEPKRSHLPTASPSRHVSLTASTKTREDARSFSALDSIASKASGPEPGKFEWIREGFAVRGGDDLDVAFDDAFCEPEGRRIVHDLQAAAGKRRSPRASSARSVASQPAPSERAQSLHNVFEWLYDMEQPSQTPKESVWPSTQQREPEEDEDEEEFRDAAPYLGDEVSQKIRELIARKRKSLALLTSALEQYK